MTEMNRHHSAEIIDPHWSLEPGYRVDISWIDTERFVVTRADDKVVFTPTFLDDVSVGRGRPGVSIELHPCECGTACFHGAIVTIKPYREPEIKYRVTRQIKDRTVWWAERCTDTPAAMSLTASTLTPVVATSDVEAKVVHA